MTTTELLDHLTARGVALSEHEGRLHVSAPIGVVTSELHALLAQHKLELLRTIRTREGAEKANHFNDPHDPHDPHAKNSEVPPPPMSATTCVAVDPPRREGNACGSCGSCGSVISQENSPSTTVRNSCGTAPTATPVSTWPQNYVLIDIETRSLVSLEEVGGRTYAYHPSTQVLCLVARLPDGTWVDWAPGEPTPEALLQAVAAGAVLIAHNAHGFDRFVWEYQLNGPRAFWVDTLHLARLAGLPGGLDDAGQALLGIAKDREGRRLTLELSRADRRTGRLPVVSPDQLARVRRYCRADVELLARLWDERLAGFAAVEIELRYVDQTINDRGFAFDRELASAIIEVEEQLARDAQLEAGVSGTLLASPAQLIAWLKEAGITVPNAQRETLEALLEDADLPADVRQVVYARLLASGITSHKLRAALRRLAVDGRLRDTLVYYAAHTGRWSGKGFQPQNLPRGAAVDLDDAVDAVLHRDIPRIHALAEAAGVRVGEVLGSLVRCCVAAPEGRFLVVVDYKSIEARALLWFAGDVEGLAVFREGGDPYRALAAKLYGIDSGAVTKTQRQLGKVLVLGCGYQMGASRFKVYAEQNGIDWSTVPVTPEQAVEAWRDAHPQVAGWRTGKVYEGNVLRTRGLWRNLEATAIQVVSTASAVGPLSMSGRDLVFTLHSGRCMVYRDARVEERPTRWGSTKHTLTYAHRNGRVPTYGGKLVENVVQATCRDLLADALVRLERHGFQLVLHVHDEVVCEVVAESEAEAEKQREVIESIMRTPPPWAAGLPLDVEGYVAKRYRK